MKSQEEELKELRKIVEAWKSINRKWVDTLFHYKQQYEALGSQVETSTKEKEKENVLTDLELMNLKNVSLLDFEVFRKKIVEAKK